jgi:hypothetical protein
MDRQLRNILQLVASGRITPAEAERWWAARRDEWASRWMVVAAISMATLATGHSLLAHGAVHAIHQFLGGAL